MRDFIVYDVTKGTLRLVDGDLTPFPPAHLEQVNFQNSSDSYSICALTPDVAILTGSGNDVINASFATGNVAIDAGSGMNFILGGRGATKIMIEPSSAPTNDYLLPSHAGELVQLNGNFASLDWSFGMGGTVLTAVQPGAAPVNIVFGGIHSKDGFQVAIGHGGAQYNIAVPGIG